MKLSTKPFPAISVVAASSYREAEWLIAQMHHAGIPLSEISIVAPRSIVRMSEPPPRVSHVSLYLEGMVRLLSHGIALDDPELGCLIAAGPVAEHLRHSGEASLGQSLTRAGLPPLDVESGIEQLRLGRPLVFVRQANGLGMKAILERYDGIAPSRDCGGSFKVDRVPAAVPA